MTQISPGIKKGQQLIMPMARLEENPDILDGYKLQTIDLRTDWQQLLQTIHNNKIIPVSYTHLTLPTNREV